MKTRANGIQKNQTQTSTTSIRRRNENNCEYMEEAKECLNEYHLDDQFDDLSTLSMNNSPSENLTIENVIGMETEENVEKPTSVEESSKDLYTGGKLHSSSNEVIDVSPKICGKIK